MTLGSDECFQTMNFFPHLFPEHGFPQIRNPLRELPLSEKRRLVAELQS
jgi:hypothetical protein